VVWEALPKTYTHSEEYLRLRVCERFGFAVEYVQSLDPRMVATLLAYDYVRRQEETEGSRRG